MLVEIKKLLTDEDPLLGPPLVINMAKDSHRLADIQDHMQYWGLRAARFEAVSGVSLPALGQHMQEAKHVVSLNLSHAAASRHYLIEAQNPFWMVMEDDCRFLMDPRIIVANVLTSLRDVDWSIVSLGCISHEKHGRRPPPSNGYDNFALEKPSGWFPWGLHAYIVNRKHAPRLVGMWSACFYPADHILLEEYRNGTGFLVRPSVSYQEEYASYQSGESGINESKRVADLHPDIIEKICAIGPSRMHPPADYQI